MFTFHNPSSIFATAQDVIAELRRIASFVEWTESPLTAGLAIGKIDIISVLSLVGETVTIDDGYGPLTFSFVAAPSNFVTDIYISTIDTTATAIEKLSRSIDAAKLHLKPLGTHTNPDAAGHSLWIYNDEHELPLVPKNKAIGVSGLPLSAVGMANSAAVEDLNHAFFKTVLGGYVFLGITAGSFIPAIGQDDPHLNFFLPSNAGVVAAYVPGTVPPAGNRHEEGSILFNALSFYDIFVSQAALIFGETLADQVTQTLYYVGTVNQTATGVGSALIATNKGTSGASYFPTDTAKETLVATDGYWILNYTASIVLSIYPQPNRSFAAFPVEQIARQLGVSISNAPYYDSYLMFNVYRCSDVSLPDLYPQVYTIDGLDFFRYDLFATGATVTKLGIGPYKDLP